MEYDRQVEAGKRWIVDRIKEMAKEENIAVESLEWKLGARDFNEEKCSLVVVVSGELKVKRFNIDDIEDSVHDKQARAKLENVLKELVKSWKL